jgi:hypothetical protein
VISSLLAVSLLAQGTYIHCISDISQEFSFYMDGRFHRQYIGEGGRDARNWGTLSKLDLSNANLLVLANGDPHVPYSEPSVAHVRRYVQAGGGLLLMADAGSPLSRVAKEFGGDFSPVRAEGTPKGLGALSDKPITLRAGGTLALSSTWVPLVADGAGRPLMARRTYGKGNVLLSVRGLFGSNPDASDPINQDWIKPLLPSIAKGREVDRSNPPREQWAELEKKLGPLTLEFHEGTKQFADAISKEYVEVRRHLVEITGVEPSPGMITRLLMLPTGGGGFSSGQRIAIGAWWGDYPKNRYPMIELIGHEAGHSWVLPHPEPIWNEPIATYLGIQVGRRMGMKEADETLKRAIDRARELDPNMDKVDIGKPGAPGQVVWGKTYWIFEQMEARHGPGAIAKYFQAKRRLAGKLTGYSLEDCVAVWSAATGADQFAWFRAHGIDVDRSRSRLPR